MGSPIEVIVPNDHKRQKMVDFLDVTYRGWADVVLNTHAREQHFSVRGKSIYGEYFGDLFGWEKAYACSVIRWVAIKIGKRKTEFYHDDGSINRFGKPIPYIVSEGCDHWPIIQCKSTKEAMGFKTKWRWCVTDQYGTYFGSTFSQALIDYALFDMSNQTAFHEEMDKVRWQETHGEREHQELSKKAALIKKKFAKPEIQKYLPIVQKEIKRLDRLWHSESEFVAYQVMTGL